MKFRERDGVCIEYGVQGGRFREEMPYVNGLSSFKEAVKIARSYRAQCGTGWVSVHRRYSCMYPPGSKFHHWSGLTHEWNVGDAGEIRRIKVFARWKLDKNVPTIKKTWYDYRNSIPKPDDRLRAYSLDQQMYDLEMIADHLGYNVAKHHMFSARFQRLREADAIWVRENRDGSDIISTVTAVPQLIPTRLSRLWWPFNLLLKQKTVA
jgi:hypothetical protein